MIGHRRICVTNLGLELRNSDELKAECEQLGGQTQHVDFALDEQGTSRGFAFVTFKEEEALKRYTQQGRHTIAGRTVRIDFDLPQEMHLQSSLPPAYVPFLQSNRLFVSFLGQSHAEPATVRNIFSQFGTITHIRFEEDAKHRPLHCCVITYADASSVSRCVSEWEQKPMQEGWLVKMAVRPEDVTRARMSQKEIADQQNAMTNMHLAAAAAGAQAQRPVSYFSSMPSLLTHSSENPPMKRVRYN